MISKINHYQNIHVYKSISQREYVVGWFDSEANFKSVHHDKVDITAVEKWLEI